MEENPAPLGIYKTPVNNGISHLSLNCCTPDFWLPSTVRSPPKTSFPLEPFWIISCSADFSGFRKASEATLQQVSTLELESVAFPYQIGCGLAGVNLGRLRVILPLSTADIPICCICSWTIPIYNLPLLLEQKLWVFIHSARERRMKGDKPKYIQGQRVWKVGESFHKKGPKRELGNNKIFRLVLDLFFFLSLWFCYILPWDSSFAEFCSNSLASPNYHSYEVCRIWIPVGKFWGLASWGI